MIPSWLYLSQTTGGSGTTIITVSAGTNDSNTVKISNLTVSNSTESEGVTVIQRTPTDTSYMEGQYLTIEMLQDGWIHYTRNSNSSEDSTLYYSRNNSEWIGVEPSASTYNIVYGYTGDIIRFKRTGHKRNRFTVDGNFKVYGNVMSLLYGDNFGGKKSLSEFSATTNPGLFYELFAYNEKLLDSSGLVLPATILTQECYQNMFYGCWKMTSTFSILPATTLAPRCYLNMFADCASLFNMPDLPATTLAQGCYYNMFNGCNNLRNVVKILPATSGEAECYYQMFADCYNMIEAPEIQLTTLSNYLGKECMGMFYNCSGITKAQDYLYPLVFSTECFSQMFAGCESLVKAPNILANSAYTGVESSCYHMFERCINLAYPPEELKFVCSHCYEGMFYECESITTAPLLSSKQDLGLHSYCYRNMFQYCTRLNYIKCLADGSNSINALDNWVDGVAASGTFVKDTDATWPTGTSGIPVGWTIINA